MKGYIFFIILFIPSVFFPQPKYYTFSELRGMEEKGNTQLFYRLYHYQHNNPPMDDYEENSIYHLDLSTNSDTLLLFDGGTLFNSFKTITDYEFWGNDPHKFIYNATYVTVDPSAYIFRYDSDQPLLYVFGGHNGNIEISNQNDSIIYSSINEILFKSINGGWKWDTAGSDPINLIALSPKNDKIIFGAANSGELDKSTDGGKKFSVVDTSKSNFGSSNKILFDKDPNYVYHIFQTQNSYLLNVSNNKGNSFSWVNRYSSSNQILVSVDSSLSGNIYLSDDKFIYRSDDYGSTFNLFKNLNRKIIGIYKEPNSNIIYAATKYDIYKITPDTVAAIKHLKLNPGLYDWYPLQIGNTWWYKNTYWDGTYYMQGLSKETVEAEVIINGKTYKKILQADSSYTNEFFIRIDSSSGVIYKKDNLNSDEYVLYDLTADVGESVTVRTNDTEILKKEDSLTVLNFLTSGRFYEVDGLIKYNITLGKYLGLVSQTSWETGLSSKAILGAKINGVMNGDSILTGVNEKVKNIPAKFSLSQNYPNPFNPSTKIKYSIPKTSIVKLQIFDILGKEIAVLINEEKHPGEYEFNFDASLYNLPSGIYFYRLSAGSFSETKKLILIR
jgi:hypothetical protein